MALNRYFQQGQSGYQRQYVPLKMPFQLMKENLAQKDADITNQLSQLNISPEVTGETSINMGSYGRGYYSDDPTISKYIRNADNLLIGDREQSQASAQNIQAKVDGILSDDVIMKAASGELADKIIGINRDLKIHQAKNKIYDERKTAIAGIYETLQKNKDWEKDPTLRFAIDEELKKSAQDPNYIPKDVGVGKYFDRTAYMLPKVNMIKDSGGKSYNLNDPDLIQWSSSRGVPASRYAAFVKDLMLDEGSELYADVERELNAMIQAGHLTTAEEVEKARASIERGLVRSAENLAHQTSDKGITYKPKDVREQNAADKVWTLLEADSEIMTSDNMSTNEALSTTNQLGTRKAGFEDAISTLLTGTLSEREIAELGGMQGALNWFKTATREDLYDKGLTNIGGYSVETLQNQYRNTANDYAHWQAQTYNLDQNVRNNPNIGFSDAVESKYNTLEYIKANPNEASQFLTTVLKYERGELSDNQIKMLQQDPRWGDIVKVKNADSDFYNNILEKTSEGTLAGSVKNSMHGDKIMDSFYITTGDGRMYDPSKALEYITSTGLDYPNDLDVNNPMEVKNWIKANSFKGYNDIYSAKDRYENAKTVSQTTYQSGIVTHPGVLVNLNDTELGFLFNEQNSNPHMSEAYDQNGKIIKNGNVTRFLHALVADNAKSAQGNLPVTMLSRGEWKASGITTQSVLGGYDPTNPESMEKLAQEYKDKMGVDLDETTKEDLKSFMESSQGFTIKFKSSSPDFNDEMFNKITDDNNKRATKNELTDTDVYREVSMDNREAISQLETKMGDALNYYNGNSSFKTTSPINNIVISTPVYEQGVGKVGENQFVVTEITRAEDNNGKPLTDFNGKIVYNFKVANMKEPIQATTTEDFINQISFVRQ